MKHVSSLVMTNFKEPEGDPMIVSSKINGKWNPDESGRLTRVLLKSVRSHGADKVKVTVGKQTKDFSIDDLLALE